MSGDRLDDLASRWFEGGLDADEERELLAALQASPAARARFAGFMRVEGALAKLGTAAGGAFADASPVSPTVVEPDRRASRRRPAIRPRRPRAWWPAAAAVAAAACVVIALVARAPTAAPTAAPPPPAVATTPTSAPWREPAATLIAAGTGTRIERGGRSMTVAAGAAIAPGDRLVVPVGAVLRWSDGTEVRLDAGTALSLATGAAGARLTLDHGALDAQVARRPAGHPLAIATADADVLVLGTRLAVETRGGGTAVAVAEGRVAVAGRDGQRVELAGGTRTVAAAGVKLVARPIPTPPAPIPGRWLAQRPAPALPPPDGAVVTVRTIEELERAVAGLVDGATIELAPGTYQLTRTLAFRDGLRRVALRGADADRDRVVLRGSGMEATEELTALHVGAVDGLTIADLTIGGFSGHLVLTTRTADVRGLRLRNVRGHDAALNFVQVASGSSDVAIEHCLLEYTREPPRADFAAAVATASGRRWRIADCEFRRIPWRDESGFTPAAVLASAGEGLVCERNRFVDCRVGIILRSTAAGEQRGGTLRNNVMWSGPDAKRPDAGIVLEVVHDVEVVHNTVLLDARYPNAIEYRYPGSTGLRIANNLCNAAITARDGAAATLEANLVDADPAWFVATGDPHLLPTAARAIDRGAAGACPDDGDGQPRPLGTAPDIGADELR